ncbi:hypothetical protein BDZ97DRAFT_739753 [Flammula alnicola]|nr:hypothetical protein BDZ97DRAFT_739753 [Flammula alnicola]
MPFVVGDFQPRPVSHERAESPPPTFHPNTQPFLGVELFVSGLRNGAPYAAEDHLNQIIRHLAANGQDLPDLTIVSPSNPGLDYVFVSLKDSQLRRNPRPDVLEMVRLIFDEQSDISARWRIAKAADKARQLSFVAEDKDKAVALKTRLENVFRIEGYKVQNSWVTDSGRITFCFLSSSVVENLLRRYPVIDNQPVLPRRSRYIQPVYGLEVAVNGVGDYPQAQHMIDEYIQRKYGEKFGDNVVRESRVVQDESVYCALLVNPEVTTQFLSDEFDLFKQIPHHNATAPKWHPEYLYSLNNQGIPTSLSAFKSAFKDDSPLMHSQLNLIRGQVELLARSLQAVIETHNDILRSMDQINQRIERTTAASFLIMTANNKLTAAQSETNSLRSEANTARLLLFTATSERAQQHISLTLNVLTNRLNGPRIMSANCQIKWTPSRPLYCRQSHSMLPKPRLLPRTLLDSPWHPSPPRLQYRILSLHTVQRGLGRIQQKITRRLPKLSCRNANKMSKTSVASKNPCRRYVVNHYSRLSLARFSPLSQ